MLVFIYVVVAEVMVIMIKMLRQTSSTTLFCIAPTFECRTLLQETVIGEDDNDDDQYHSCHNGDRQVSNRLQALSSQLPLFSPTGMIHIGLVRVGRWVGVFIIVIIIIVKIIVVGRACSPRRGLSAYSSTKNQ